MIDEPALELRDVSKRFGSTVALDRVDLRVSSGESVALLGPSGCGKSTLLRTLIGLVRPDSGYVLVDDRPLAPESLAEVRRGIGYVIQEGGLFPHLTAEGNLALAARQVGWSDERIRERLDELLELVRLPGDLLDRWPRELSGGQRQRIALARALMLDPAILLLDEPLGALDPLVRAELQDDLLEIFRRLRKTVVLVTHDLPEAGHFGDRIALFDRGRLVQVGPPEDLRERPADDFVRRFVTAQRSLWT